MYQNTLSYNIFVDESNIEVFVDLSVFDSYKDFLANDFISHLFSKMENATVQKLWDFLYHNSIVEAWWKDEYIYSDFLVNFSKHRKIYPRSRMILFVRERLLPFNIYPSNVFDFLRISSSRKLIKFDQIIIKSSRKLFECELCKRNVYITELVEHIQVSKGICVYCYGNMTPEDRKKVENFTLKMNRLSETWKILTLEEKTKFISKHLKKTLDIKSFDDVKYFNKLVDEIAHTEDFANLSEILSSEIIRNMMHDLDKNLFDIWWERVELRGISNETKPKV